MKKLTILFGYLAAICMALFLIFKVGHYPGTFWLMMASCFLFSLVYAPLLFVQRLKAAENLSKKILSVLVFLAMLLAGVTLSAKFAHCSFAQPLACITYTLIILVILFQIWKGIKAKEPKCQLTNHNLAIGMTMVLVLFTFLQMSTLPRGILDEFNCVTGNQDKEITYFTAKANSFFENFDKNAGGNATAENYYVKAQEINAQSDSLVAYIRSVGEEMIQLAEKKPVSFDSLENVCHKANVKAVEEVLYEQHKDSLLQAKMAAYATFVGENTNSRGKEILDAFFTPVQPDSTQACAKKCEKKCSQASCCGQGCCTCTLICQLSTFRADILHIRMLQAETLNYLQTMQAKAMMKVEEKAK